MTRFIVAPGPNKIPAPHFCGIEEIWLLHLSSSRVNAYYPMPTEKRIKASLCPSLKVFNSACFSF